jgi:uncharacterized membrane protein
MGNYIIIGGDNKEYGPVSEADVRQWIAEGRLNADSRVKAESDAEFRALALFPEFAGAFQAAKAAAAPSPGDANFLDRDYELDLGGCITRGWGLYKTNFGALFGAFIIMLLVYLAFFGAMRVIQMPFATALLQAPPVVAVMFQYLTSLASSLVVGPLSGGLFLVYLKTIRGEPTGAGEVFAGFQRAYVPLFLGSLVVAMIAGACTLPFSYVLTAKTAPLTLQMQAMQHDPAALQRLMPQLMSAFSSSLPVLCVCMIPAMFFLACLQFTLPLIMDKQMAVAAALKASWHMTLKHFWQVLGLTLLVGLVTALGLLGCCIGIMFTAPIGLAAMMFAYETIFGVQKT